jgi:hypothetical protein
LMPIRIRIGINMEIRIRILIGIKTVPIHNNATRCSRRFHSKLISVCWILSDEKTCCLDLGDLKIVFIDLFPLVKVFHRIRIHWPDPEPNILLNPDPGPGCCWIRIKSWSRSRPRLFYNKDNPSFTFTHLNPDPTKIRGDLLMVRQKRLVGNQQQQT